MCTHGTMKHFFIAALPRSRTKWLSNFLTYGGAFCCHEGEYFDQASGYTYLGDANTTFCLYGVPCEGPIVVIRRNKNDVIESLIRIFGYPDKMPEIVGLLETGLNNINGLHINYNDINERLEEIWQYCIPSIQYDPLRAEALKKSRIEVNDYTPYQILFDRGLTCQPEQ